MPKHTLQIPAYAGGWHSSQAGQAPQTISTTDHTHLLLQQPAGETYTWKVASRCAINDESAYTAPQTYTLPADDPDEPSWIADPTQSFEDEEEWETPTQETGDETGETDGDQPSEEETPNLDDLLNTPVTIITAPEGTDLPEGLPSTLSQLPPDANTEQLQEAVKSVKPTCAGMVATYVCGSHDGTPQYAGEKITVAAGDDIAMNSLILSVVNIDGGGNGAGLIKIPMMNNIKLGVTLSGIQVAKGGCIVAGRAELSGVSASILNDQQREQLAKIYTAYMAATQLGIDNAGAIAKSYNTFAEKLNGIKDQANALVSNLKGGKATQKEVEALKQLTESTTASMQTTLDAMRKAHGENINKEIAAELQKNIDANKVSIATLTNFKIGRDDPAVATAAANTLAAVDPVKTEKDMKTLGPLAVEYNGKVYENGKTVKINPESLDGIIQGSSDIALNCGFFLKNIIESEPITWKIETSNGTKLPLVPPLLISALATDAYLGIKWPQDQSKLKLTATAGSRSVSINLEKPAYTLSNLTAVDYNTTARKATAGQTLYLVKAPASAEKATISWSSNIEPSLLKTHYTVNGNAPTGNITSNKITYSFSDSPSTTAYRINAMGYDKTVKVAVVDVDLTYEDKSTKFKYQKELAYALDMVDYARSYLPKGWGKIVNNKNEWLKANTEKDGFVFFIQPKAVATSFNEEDKNSRLYYRKTDHYLSVEAGVQGETPDIPVPGLATPKFSSSFFGYSFEAYAGVYLKLAGKASGEIGLGFRGYDYVEDKTKNSEKFIVNPAKVGLEVKGSVAAKGKAGFYEGKTILAEGQIIGEASVAGEIVRIEYLAEKKAILYSSPLIEKGIRFRFDVKAKAELKGWPPYEATLYRAEAFWKPE